MSATLTSLDPPFDSQSGGVLLANMIEAWLVAEPSFPATAEVTDELEDHRTSPEQASLYLCPPVDDCSGPLPSGEHGAPVCATTEGCGTGLERAHHPHSRPGPGAVGCPDGGQTGLQDIG